MGVYESLVQAKANGALLDLKKLSPSDLRTMFVEERISDSLIADLFGVSRSRVTYLRRKHGFTARRAAIDQCLSGRTVKARAMNREAKGRILTSSSVSTISKAVTHFAFRNGPVEDMHANGQLSQDDMKTLNKFMVNRLAYVFSLIAEERWLEFEWLVWSTDRYFGADWDDAQPDNGGSRELLEMELRDYRSYRRKF
jgi:hypothetical protein